MTREKLERLWQSFLDNIWWMFIFPFGYTGDNRWIALMIAWSGGRLIVKHATSSEEHDQKVREAESDLDLNSSLHWKLAAYRGHLLSIASVALLVSAAFLGSAYSDLREYRRLEDKLCWDYEEVRLLGWEDAPRHKSAMAQLCP